MTKNILKTVIALLLALIFNISIFANIAIATEDLLEHVGESPITASVNVTDDIITVTGRILGGTKKQVTLLVKDKNDKIAYINQFESEENGDFTHNFYVSDYSADGIFNLYLGGENVLNIFSTTFYHYKNQAPVYEDTKFASAKLNIAFNSYVIHIGGTIYCEAGNKLTLTAVNQTDQLELINTEVIKKNGDYVVDCTLPSTLLSKNYTFLLTVYDTLKNKTLATVDILASTGFSLSLTGTSVFADGVKADVTVVSNNSNIANKSATITGTGNYNYSIVNLIAFASVNFNVNFYEKRDVNPNNNPVFEISEISFYSGINRQKITSLKPGFVETDIECKNITNESTLLTIFVELYEKQNNIKVYSTKSKLRLNTNEKNESRTLFNIPDDVENYYMKINIEGEVYGKRINLIREYNK